ncbi:MAG: MFS transporter [Deltaproteobacteria bacterium]|jgi:MFS transporter, DHA3 family, macrolide efflux protein|nr:MFS transporter [Deltaproteobacteria bacterium]MBT4091903.1 MFS transporter [Deltaproteobacteria bacterium]MBT4262666.1 MFS transporter [Deltaproteobacteria bacterium]MBT4643211.1 MFS transporter [Deltaproteobacteria bacterium]MBT6503750.1 MFS transporter [Deltaproteobacteria bacterium]
MRLNKNLTILLSGQLVSQIGDKFYLLALSYWVLESTKSAALMGVVLFFTLLPETVLGLAAGAVVDKYNRKWIIVITDFLRGLIVLFLALLFYLDSVSIGWIVVAQVLLSLNTAFFNPCIPAVVPQIVAQEKLGKANAQTQLIRGISTVAGPVLGGLSVATFGYLFVFAFNGISFIISALFELFLRIPEIKRSTVQSSLIADIKEGFFFVVQEKTLAILIVSIAVIHFFVGTFQIITPVLANQLNGRGVQNLGFLQTAFGIGMITISLIFGLVNFLNKREGTVLFGSVFLVGTINVVIALFVYTGISGVQFFLIPFFIYGGLIILAVTSFRTLVQKSIPNNMAGRVFGVAFSVGDVSIPIAMLIYGVLLDQFQVSHLLLLSGTGLMVFTLFLFRMGQTKPV